MENIEFKVLILDDEIEITEIIHDMLTKAGIFCEVFNDPLLALAALSQQHYATVLSDISIPKLNGIDLLKKVRASGNDVPFVFLTAFNDNQLLRSALKLGAIDFISKPFKKDEVIEILSRSMEIGVRSQNLKLETNPEKRKKDAKFIQKLRIGKK